MAKGFSRKKLKASKSWADYQADHFKHESPLLFPVTIEMVADGSHFEFKMDRMSTKQLGEMTDKILDNVPVIQRDNIKTIIQHYVDDFKDIDESESPVPASPLDFDNIEREVIFLIYLNHENWTFSGHKQFGCPNDDHSNPNVRQLATFDGQRGILVQRTGKVKYRLKYDFYVTVHQKDGRATDIIIDPRDEEGSGTGD